VKKSVNLRFLVVIPTAFLVFALGGCDFVNNADPDLKARLTDTGIDFVVCRDVHVSDLTLSVLDDHGTGWVSYWSASGGADIEAGEAINTDTLASMFGQIEQDDQPGFNDSSKIELFLNSEGAGADLLGTFSAADLLGADSDWVDYFGRSSVESCP
jgi:hypothetical protein